MFKIIVGAHKKVGIRIVQGLSEGDNLHVSLTQQRQTLLHYEVVEFGTTTRPQFVRTDLNKALHLVGPNE